MSPLFVKNGCVGGRFSLKVQNYQATFLPNSFIRNNGASTRFREGLSMKASSIKASSMILSIKDHYVLKYLPVC